MGFDSRNLRVPAGEDPAATGISATEATWDHLDRHLTRLLEPDLRKEAAVCEQQARELLMRAAHNYDHLKERAHQLHMHMAVAAIDDSQSLAAERSE
jgi:hypothetical protein